MRDVHQRRVGLAALGMSLMGLGVSSLLASPGTQGKRPIFPKIAPSGPPPILTPTDPKYWAKQRKDFHAVTNHAWVYQKWTGNDAPYAAARSQVEHDFAVSVEPQDLLARYKTAAQRQPNNALAQFTWAYGVRLADRSPAFHIQDRGEFLDAANVALSEASSPHTYNYDRLRFLLWIQEGAGAASHHLEGIAYRLLQKAPNDYPVLVGLSLIYTQNRDRVAQKKGYALIQKMMKMYPNRPDAYDLLGCWYYTQYMFYGNIPDYHQAMAYYQKALGMYPVGSVRRAQLPGVMAYLTTRFHQISGT